MVWEAQVVTTGSSMRLRPRGPAPRNTGTHKSAKGKLYALRRRFVVVVDADGIAIKVLGNFAPWWSTQNPRRIVAKKRLVKIIDGDNQSIIIRLEDEDKVFDFAGAIRDEWGIEPLMHAAVVEDDGSEDQREVERMAALFVTSPEFRERIRQMHGRLGELWTA